MQASVTMAVGNWQLANGRIGGRLGGTENGSSSGSRHGGSQLL